VGWDPREGKGRGRREGKGGEGKGKGKEGLRAPVTIFLKTPLQDYNETYIGVIYIFNAIFIFDELCKFSG